MKIARMIGAAMLLFIGAAWMLQTTQGDGPKGAALTATWIVLVFWLGLLWWLLDQTARHANGYFSRWLAPLLLGVSLLYLWELVVLAFEVPRVLLPAPHAVGQALASRWEVLWPDFRQTAYAVVAGYVIGCGAGFAVALLADRFGVLKRGLLPLAALYPSSASHPSW
jgi:NitT/TauT family transport system permease protein